MWRSILAVFLMPSLTAAQSTAPAGSPVAIPSSSPDTVTSHSQGPIPRYGDYTFYTAIRRGTEEEVAIQLWMRDPVSAPKSALPGIVPLKLELEPSAGLSYRNLRYPKSHKQKFSFQLAPIPVASRPVMQFKLRADSAAGLGPRILKGKITFQAIQQDTGLGPLQQIDVEVPITVVEHDAKVGKTYWPFPHTPVALVVVLIVLSPVLIAIAIPYYLICAAVGPQKCPD